MRVFHAAALTAAAMLLASITSAQGLGTAAAREREKRSSAPAKPVKVYTDREVASTPTSVVDAPQATPAAGGSAGGGAVPETGSVVAPEGSVSGSAPEGGTPAVAEEQTPEQKAAAEEEKAAAAEAEARVKAEEDWRGRLEKERKAEATYTEQVARLNAVLGDLSSVSYGANRAQQMNRLEEAKQKLAAAQANIAALEEEGRRNAYR